MAGRHLVPGIRVVEYEPDNDGEGGGWGLGRIFVKPNRPDMPWLVANEFLGSRLATAIGLPTPPGDLGQDPNHPLLWVTTVIEAEDMPFAPADTDALVEREPDLAAGIFVFDVWILNIDRNDENLITHPRKLGVWVIDHEQAFAADKTGEPGIPGRCRDRALPWHLFRDSSLDQGKLADWSARVLHLPPSVIKRIVNDGARRDLYDREMVTELVDFISYRQQRIRNLVRLSLPDGKVQAGDDPFDEGGETG